MITKTKQKPPTVRDKTVRARGYYWVKYRVEPKTSWEVAKWNGYDWFYSGIESDMPEPPVIGPRIEPPVLNWRV